MSWQALVIYVAVFLSGYVLGRLTRRPVTRVIEEQLMDTSAPKRSRLPGTAVQWIVIGLLVFGLGVVGIVDQRRYDDVQKCQSEYITGAARYTQALQEATQAVLDDAAAGKGLSDAEKVALAKKFYRDLAAEHAAFDALKHYRKTHLPAETCS